MTTTQSTRGLGVTTADHPNAARMRGGFDAFARGDLAAVEALSVPGASWTIAGTGPLAGTHRGWTEVSTMFGRLFELTGGTFTMELVSVLADDVHAVAVYDGTSTVAGRTETHRMLMLDELTPEGLTRTTRLFALDQDAADRHMGR